MSHARCQEPPDLHAESKDACEHGGTQDCPAGDVGSKKSDDFRTLVVRASTLPRSLLRAVPAHLALSGYGKYFKNNAGTSEDFEASLPTDIIDDFISHDWQTARLDKTLTLLFLYNSTAAMKISMAVAVALAAAQVAAGWHLPRDAPPTVTGFVLNSLCLCVGSCVYFTVLFHWQRIRQTLPLRLRSRLLFVDKLCIHQDDPELKEQGVMGLAAFLGQSRRMVILWSPHYFTRLWCTYELAAWFASGRQARDTILLPVVLARFVLVAKAFLIMHTLALRSASVHLTLSTFLIDGSLVVFGAACSYIFLDIHAQLKRMNKQLASFRIRDAKCFCCTDYSQHVAAFDEGVQTLLRRLVVSMVCADTVHLQYSDLVTCSLALVWKALDELTDGWSRGKPLEFLVALTWGSVSVSLLVAPCTALLFCQFVARATRLEGCEHACGRLGLAVFVLGPLFGLITFVLWFPGRLCFKLRMYWGQVLWDVLLASLLLFLLCATKPRHEEVDRTTASGGRNLKRSFTVDSQCMESE
eukprot:TRINITY_DN16668_c0_g1_i1.p1 TRINITY_DN16668_c0_g1~~TRINITY_DN16668_c0_g1_i1.p1  ORF type:complete len:526 (-),score=55.08 TRINITY_DN16668_c0_g1_i1:49-1626(-)